MISLSEYSVGVVLSRSLHSTVYEGRRLADGLAVVLKVREDEQLSRGKIETQREYAILQRLTGTGIVRPVELIEKGSTPVMVLEQFDGVSLVGRCQFRERDA